MFEYDSDLDWSDYGGKLARAMKSKNNGRTQDKLLDRGYRIPVLRHIDIPSICKIAVSIPRSDSPSPVKERSCRFKSAAAFKSHPAKTVKAPAVVAKKVPALAPSRHKAEIKRQAVPAVETRLDNRKWSDERDDAIPGISSKDKYVQEWLLKQQPWSVVDDRIKRGLLNKPSATAVRVQKTPVVRRPENPDKKPVDEERIGKNGRKPFVERQTPIPKVEMKSIKPKIAVPGVPKKQFYTTRCAQTRPTPATIVPKLTALERRNQIVNTYGKSSPPVSAPKTWSAKNREAFRIETERANKILAEKLLNVRSTIPKWR